MRDPKRIDRVLEIVKIYWKSHPDLRLAQLISNMYNKQMYLDKRRRAIHKTRELILQIKKEKKCNRCKEDDPICLDFHHIGKKSFSISSAINDGYSLRRIYKEIEKCIVLCANCHRKEHHNARVA